MGGDWNESSRIRKDFRHSHDGPEVPRGYRAVSADKKRKKKRQSRRWCRGKVGVEHEVVLVDKWGYHLANCSKCGLNEYNLPVEALAQVYERARNYVEYRELCKEFGHTWEETELNWSWYHRKIKCCVICNDSPQLFSWSSLDKL